jgi:hypothetical protein
VTSVPAPTSRTTSGTSATGVAVPVTGPDDGSGPARPRTLRLPPWVAASVVGLGLALLVLVTTADRVPLWQVPAGPSARGVPPGPLTTVSATASPTTGSTTAPPIVPFDLPWVRPLVLTLLALVALIMVAGTVVALVQVARRLWQDRWQAPDVLHAMTSERLDVDLSAPRDAVEEAAERMREALRTGTPRNAVVQCWLLLVHSLERHGVTGHPAQSPTELARHALSQVSTDAGAVAELTALFLEARFSEHPIGEESRRRAESALQRIIVGLQQHRVDVAVAGTDSPQRPGQNDGVE